MSYYYKYTFISPEQLYAKVKEEFSSYFDTGIIDDLLFPIWTVDCLDKLGRGSYQIKETYLELKDYQARLPSDFKAVREVWGCVTSYQSAPLPGALYTQTTMRITPHDHECGGDCDECSPCAPDIRHITYKTTNEVLLSFQRTYLLKPGNISNNNCGMACANYGASTLDSFDIVDNKIVTNIQQANLNIVYYANSIDDCDNVMIPDDYRIKAYIEAYLKYKLYEKLYNSVTDESFNQIERKYMYYKQEYQDAYTMANIETKKETIYDRHRKRINSKNRFNNFNID